MCIVRSGRVLDMKLPLSSPRGIRTHQLPDTTMMTIPVTLATREAHPRFSVHKDFLLHRYGLDHWPID